MSVDSTDDEYHLTPNGWIEGTHYFYGSPEKIIPRPPGCVETIVRHMRQSHSFAKEHVDWETIWTSPDVPQAQKEVLRRRFPRPD